eukprot:g82792.t1
MFLSVFLLCLDAVTPLFDPGCTPSCTSGGATYQFDFKQLVRYPGEDLYEGTDGEYKFTMNVCASSRSLSSNDKCTGLLCQYSLPREEFVANVAQWDVEQPNEVGVWEPIDPKDCRKGMQLVLTNVHDCVMAGVPGLNRVATIKYICDPTGPEVPSRAPHFQVLEYDVCKYEVHMPSQSACDSSFLCAHVPCKNNGICSVNASTPEGISCTCTDDFTGPTCEEANPCVTGPCHNGGSCIPLGGGQYTCLCHSAYAGKHCELRTGQELCTASSSSSAWRAWGIFCIVTGLGVGMLGAVRYYRTKILAPIEYTTQTDDLGAYGGSI